MPKKNSPMWLVGSFPTIPVLHFINWNALGTPGRRPMPRMPGILMDALDLEIPTRWRRWELEYWGRSDLAPLEHCSEIWEGGFFCGCFERGWLVFFTISFVVLLVFYGEECWPGMEPICVSHTCWHPQKKIRPRPPKFNMAPEELPSLPGKG